MGRTVHIDIHISLMITLKIDDQYIKHIKFEAINL
jgi:preprotein translocase subunit SecB